MAGALLISPVTSQARPDTSAAAAVVAPGSAPLTVGDGRRVTLLSLGGSGTDAVMTRVAADIGTAVTRVEAMWGVDWSHDIVIIATESDAQFATESGGATSAQGPDIAAVAVADHVDVDNRTVTGQRIVLAPGAATMSASALRIVLGHELFHYAARAETALDAPRWLTEGVADFVARPAPAALSAFGVPTVLPADTDFAAAGPRLSSAYDRAWLFARFVAESYGVPTLRLLYQRACRPGHVDTETAMRNVLGATPAELLARWQHWMAG